ncbi:MAG: hypothetical protein GXO64_00825 [Candidatus Micrarchaeota archaeon]|nr:hypothetical protein [Candidatus Micrarchaeota archaeon]
MPKRWKRREFIKKTAVTTTAISVAGMWSVSCTEKITGPKQRLRENELFITATPKDKYSMEALGHPDNYTGAFIETPFDASSLKVDREIIKTIPEGKEKVLLLDGDSPAFGAFAGQDKERLSYALRKPLAEYGLGGICVSCRWGWNHKGGIAMSPDDTEKLKDALGDEYLLMLELPSPYIMIGGDVGPNGLTNYWDYQMAGADEIIAKTYTSSPLDVRLADRDSFRRYMDGLDAHSVDFKKIIPGFPTNVKVQTEPWNTFEMIDDIEKLKRNGYKVVLYDDGTGKAVKGGKEYKLYAMTAHQAGIFKKIAEEYGVPNRYALKNGGSRTGEFYIALFG